MHQRRETSLFFSENEIRNFNEGRDIRRSPEIFLQVLEIYGDFFYNSGTYMEIFFTTRERVQTCIDEHEAVLPCSTSLEVM